jgi:ubiquinone/menaquinone biosynthesis C-methylase UbiE
VRREIENDIVAMGGMVEKAIRRIHKTGQRNYSLYLCDCRHLPFDDETFDVLCPV